MWPRVALRCTSCKNRHIAASALLTARRGASASAGDGAEGQQQHQPLSTKSGASSPSAASPSAGAAGAEQLKGSRFQRSNNNASSTAKLPPSAANGETAEQADKRGGAEAAPVNVDILLRRLTVPHDFRTQPSLFRYLQRLQVALRVNALFIGDAYARCELHKVLLPSVQGVDIEIVVLILQTLQLVDADASSPLLHDAVAWLSLYTVNMSLAQCLKVVELLQHFQPALAEEFMRWAVQRLQPRDIPALSATQAVVLLTSLLQRLPHLVSLSSTASTPAAEAGGGETGRVGRNAEHSSADAALLELAASLRDRCKGAELLAVPADHIVQLLRALLSATSSRALASDPQTHTWSALLEATCALLSSPPMADAMSLAASAQLLESLMDAARKRELQTASDASPSTNAAEAEERLTSVLVEHLRKAAAALAASAATSCASSAAVAALPSPWKPRDVREVWGVLLRASQKATSASPSFTTTTAEALAELRRVLLTYVSTLAAAHPEDNGVTELAFLVARSVVQADRVAAQHARELQPGISGSMGGAASATDDEVIRCDLSAVLPPALLEALVEGSAAQLKAASITWTSAAVADAISLFSTSSDEAHRTSSTLLAFAWYKQLQTAAQGGERVTPQALLAFFTPELLRTERVGVDAAVAASLRRWSVSEVLYFLAHIAGDRSNGCGDSGSLEAASVLRTAGAALCVYAGRASAAQLAALMECFGAARVRSDEFCDAVITRLAELLRVNVVSNARRLDYTSLSVARGADASEPQAGTASDSSGATGSSAGDEARVGDAAALSIAQLTQLLRCFALLEVRKTQPFLDAAPHVIRAATEDRGTAEEVTQLLAAYAKLLIWNYPVYRALAERLCRIPPDTVTLGQLVTAQLALLRMDVTLPEVTTRFYIGLVERYGEVNAPHVSGEEGDAATSPRAALMDIVMHLSLLSRLHNRSPVPFTEPQVVTEMTRRLLKHANVLSCADVAEVLLSLARLGEGSSPAFDQLTMQALGQLPTAPPRVMAHLVEAYALAGRGDQAELFALVADRTVAMRHDMAAVTIASILHSFATAGVRNDRLFIEGIPRVRHVATYGTPRDIVNVVSAYAAVNLWHYKLFAKLADRAVQLRADFRVSELVSLLTAYATVQMRYDTLFTEFAPRIQTLMHLLTPSDLSAIVSSYNTLDIPCPPVWKATAERAVVVVDDFTETEAEKLLSAYSMQGFYNEACVAALTERFPALSSIPFETRDAEAEEGKADEKVASEKAAGAGGEVSAEEQRQ